eukprot:GFUD01075752.1.p1 GENE.GFUD01075752.1~~GFUD01075752.1.p1  ORF type:complete len:102 (-),score=8.67 GFUD01075752.1:16-321(-)
MFPLMCVFALALPAAIRGQWPPNSGMVTPGYCLKSNLDASIKGKILLGQTKNAVDCFKKMCRLKVIIGTGCEWDQKTNCFIHTEEVLVGSGDRHVVCLVFP